MVASSRRTLENMKRYFCSIGLGVGAEETLDPNGIELEDVSQ